jgi:hypothetical protein
MAPAFSFGMPQQIPVKFPDRQSNSSQRNHDITPDGKFIGVVRVDPDRVNTRDQIDVVLNWFDELNGKLTAR